MRHRVHWNAASDGPIVCRPDGGLNNVNGGKTAVLDRASHIDGTGSEPGPCSEEIASNHVIYGMPQSCEWFTANFLIKYLNRRGYTIFSCTVL